MAFIGTATRSPSAFYLRNSSHRKRLLAWSLLLTVMLSFLLLSMALTPVPQSYRRGDRGAFLYVRTATTEDASAIAALLAVSVSGLAPLHYTNDQVEAWRYCLPTAQQCRQRLKQGRRTTWVACTIDESRSNGTKEERVIGMMDLVDQQPSSSAHHLDCAYVHPAFIRRRIASMLYDSLERCAKSMPSCNRLYTEASEGAKPFFARNGFVTVERQDVVIGSVTLWNYRMEKDLI